MDNSREGETKNNKLFSAKAKETRCRKQEKMRKEDLGTRVDERPLRRACSMHEGSMLMKRRSRQAFCQGVGDIEGTPTFVKLDFAGTYSLADEMKFNIDVTTAIAIDGILTDKNTCSIVFPHACGQEGSGRSLIKERGGRRSSGRQRLQRRIQLHWERA